MMHGKFAGHASAALLGLLLGASLAGTGAMGAGIADQDACGLGERVLAVRAALEDPDMPGAMRAVVELGTDSRYYVMVRGWLAMQLQADLGIVEASRGNVPASVAGRVEFLHQAIRAIDLE